MCSDMQATLPERRTRARGGYISPHRSQLIERVLGSFHEMPGLKLTLEQASRLLGIDSTTCQVIFDDLVRSGQLRRLSTECYALPDVA
jgi:hypothetical protein